MTGQFNARVTVTLKAGVLDPQGQAITNATKTIDIKQIAQVRQGKIFDIVVNAKSADEAYALINRACDKLLANKVMEEYNITVSDDNSANADGS